MEARSWPLSISWRTLPGFTRNTRAASGGVSRVGRVAVVSGRAGYEIVQKAIGAFIPLLAAVGAPSSLAVAMAREFNQTLVGFLRGDRFNVYSAPERLTK